MRGSMFCGLWIMGLSISQRMSSHQRRGFCDRAWSGDLSVSVSRTLTLLSLIPPTSFLSQFFLSESSAATRPSCITDHSHHERHIIDISLLQNNKQPSHSALRPSQLLKIRLPPRLPIPLSRLPRILRRINPPPHNQKIRAPLHRTRRTLILLA